MGPFLLHGYTNPLMVEPLPYFFSEAVLGRSNPNHVDTCQVQPTRRMISGYPLVTKRSRTLRELGFITIF